MSEQEIREGMLLAVWDEPPLDFDPDTLIRRVEQKKSRRRALVGVGVATAVIAVASFALPGLLPRDRDSQLGSDGQTSASATPSESAEIRVQRIGDKLAEKLALTEPTLKEVYSDLKVGRSGPSGTQVVPGNPGDWAYWGYVYLTDPIGPTALRVEATRFGFSVQSFCASAVLCRDVPQKDGSVVTEAEFTDGSPEIARAETVRKYPSGLVVKVSSFAYNPATGSGVRQTVPVHVGVLTSLVTDPSVNWE
ncbi:hypothetical protein [Lentzea nigeriaca]|uniref:hypothetical protein n=1 Tax=Lentzea nigeriaca TaxID=1128665 RepID=UPI00195CE52A|nr:hypothetical protein [Lentzea nigeriaca]MBM7861394.1 hypothetical protein [Lentzea nigeriaca]